MRRHPALFSLAVLCAGLSASAGRAQPSDAAGAGAKPATIDLNTLPPGLRLGARANFVQRKLGVLPTLVLVPDNASYVAAIAAWSTTHTGAVRYPILIDDGSWAGQQRIMRFVRAFKPDTVVRWSAPAPQNGKPAWPDDLEARKALIASAAASAWGAKSPADLPAKWTEFGFEPCGVVFAWPDDPSWTAALALAAGRGEPLLWAKPNNSATDGAFDLPDAEKFSASVGAALEQSGLAYRKMGDTIDALTLCLNIPVKVALAAGDKRGMLATTDFIGRAPDEPRRERWAFTSQIIGGSASAAYDAMCAMFLLPEKAWLFDGYDSSQPWVQWDMTKAAEPLAAVGIASILDDAPNGAGLPALRARSAGTRMGAADPGAPEAGMGIDAGFIAFNTKGNTDFFELAPGQAKPIDIPILRRPAMEYFVHSWSANMPLNRATVAGIWLERGVYAYIGSVHEPYLQAFIPTPVFAARLAAGFAWSAIPRQDDAPPWKIAVFGDALATVGPQAPRIKSELPLKGAENLTESVPKLLADRKLAQAVRTLALLGRDKDAARLCIAVARDDAAAFSPEVALAGISSCFFTGDYAGFLVAAKGCAPALADEPRVAKEGLAEIRDMVWQALWPSFARASSEEADLAAACLRPEVLARDAAEAFRALKNSQGDEAARRFLSKVRQQVKDRATSDEIDRIGR